jgi:hypothetical protein
MITIVSVTTESRGSASTLSEPTMMRYGRASTPRSSRLAALGPGSARVMIWAPAGEPPASDAAATAIDSARQSLIV